MAGNYSGGIHFASRHDCEWPIEKLNSVPWLFVPSDACVVSPFCKPHAKAMLSWAERDVAQRVVLRARAAQHDGDGVYWVYPDRDGLQRITGTKRSWPALWAAGKQVVEV